MQIPIGYITEAVVQKTVKLNIDILGQIKRMGLTQNLGIKVENGSHSY